MSLQQKLKHELRALGLAGLFFGSWIAVLLVLKDLLLAEYDIAFHGWSAALVGALVLSKVVHVLEHVPLGAWVDTTARTLLYSLGFLMVLLLEKAFEVRHEHGGFGPSLKSVFQHAEIHHVWVNAICLSGALFTFNALSVVRRHLGEGGLRRLFLETMPRPPSMKQ